MKHIIALVCLAFVACVFAAEKDPAESIISEMTALKSSTEQFADNLKKFLSSETDKKAVKSESKEKLKEMGGILGDAEAKLSEQMGKLGEFLELPHLPPPSAPPAQSDII